MDFNNILNSGIQANVKEQILQMIDGFNFDQIKNFLGEKFGDKADLLESLPIEQVKEKAQEIVQNMDLEEIKNLLEKIKPGQN